jgi:hypothetical protein
MTSNPARDTFSPRRGAKYEHKCNGEEWSNVHDALAERVKLEALSINNSVLGEPIKLNGYKLQMACSRSYSRSQLRTRLLRITYTTPFSLVDSAL